MGRAQALPILSYPMLSYRIVALTEPHEVLLGRWDLHGPMDTQCTMGLLLNPLRLCHSSASLPIRCFFVNPLFLRQSVGAILESWHCFRYNRRDHNTIRLLEGPLGPYPFMGLFGFYEAFKDPGGPTLA